MGTSIVRKYSNRRLYDSEQRRCITLGELASKIEGGSRVRVVDAKSGADLTATTLVQILIERRKAATLVSVDSLMEMIRLDTGRLQMFLGPKLKSALERFLSEAPRDERAAVQPGVADPLAANAALQHSE